RAGPRASPPRPVPTAVAAARPSRFRSCRIPSCRPDTGTDQTPGGSDLGPETRQVIQEVISCGDERLVRHRSKRIEDEQCGGGVLAELGAARLAPVPSAARHAGVVAPDDLIRIRIF